MTCDCAVDRLLFDPREHRELLPDSPDIVAICPDCLAIEPSGQPSSNGTATPADLADISPAFPPVDGAAVPMVLAVGLLDSLAVHRTAIEELLVEVEAAGVDPLLILDRLQTDPHLELRMDCSRRRRQLEQLRE